MRLRARLRRNRVGLITVPQSLGSGGAEFRLPGIADSLELGASETHGFLPEP